MREIKFRAWGRTPESDEPVMTKPFDFKKYVMYHEEAQSNLLPTVGEDVVYMQFTGLEDKNGVEIYEGDILHEYEEVVDPWRDDDSKDYTQDQLHEVRYLTGNKYDGFRCVSQPTEYYAGDNYYVTWIKPKTMEVIGNIYENKELLESKDV
jgi:uncharacterized phage protein (TIGR01671 family)